MRLEIFTRCLRKISSLFQGLSIKYSRHLGNFYEVNEFVVYVNIDSDEHSRHLIFRDRFNFEILYHTYCRQHNEQSLIRVSAYLHKDRFYIYTQMNLTSFSSGIGENDGAGFEV